MRFYVAERRPAITRGCRSLEFWRYGQAAAVRHGDEAQATIAGCVIDHAADVALGLGICVCGCRIYCQAAADVVDVRLNAVDVGVLTVVDFGKAVLP